MTRPLMGDPVVIPIIDMLITDAGIKPDFKKMIQDLGIEVVIAEE